MKLNFEGLSINTVLIFGAVAGVIYLAWKAKNAWDAVDLNPFDDAANAVENLINSAGTDYYKEAAKAQGIDLSKYKPWVGGRGAVRPSNAIWVKSGRTGSWFVPK